MANDRDELTAYRRMAELEARAGTPEADPLKDAAPYYLGPLGSARAGRDILKGVDELTTRAGYASGGLATDAATMAFGAEPETAAKVGVAANMAAQGVMGGAVGSLVRAPGMMMNAGRRLMQSAVKPSAEALKSGAAPKAIETMLQKDINATAGGIAPVKARVGALETEIQSILEKSPATVNKGEVAKHLKTAVDDVRFNLDRAENIKDLEGVLTKFWNHPEIKALGDIPVATANKMKQAFYKELKDKSFAPGASLTPSAKGEKTLASGLRAEIGKAEPGVVPSLKEQSELLNVLKVAGPQVLREGNKNIIGLGTLAPRLEQVAVWMLDRYPWFKSYLARQAYNNPRLPQELATAGVITQAGVRQQQE